MYCLFPHGANSQCRTECEEGFFGGGWILAVITLETILNNILKSFVLACLNDKSNFRLSLLIGPFSSVTKFIAEHDRVPHVLRDDGGKMQCDAMIKEGNVISFP